MLNVGFVVYIQAFIICMALTEFFVDWSVVGALSFSEGYLDS